ncbi:uncharacterized protein LOC123870596 isoform X1 [Maniola jurtina]|uniref:uncharacterized protein LOC123870596 isoform X1 n=1 Tax=Maniola jurtina TaxID=191418 RepID=UPI001E68C8CF|nr:uncharacterized protein LOC123870596 isoform X1 [Maniola jurtina]
MDQNTIIVVSVFGAALLLLLLISGVLCAQVASLRRKVSDLSASGRLRVQLETKWLRHFLKIHTLTIMRINRKLKMNPDKNHAFHNPGLTPDEELSRRGYSMYQGPDDDVESGRGTERQTGGQFVEELAKELDKRQHKQDNTPNFLLQGVDETKKKINNPVANHVNRQSETNPNFIY